MEDAKEVLHGKNQLADQFSSTEIAIIIDDVINRKPRFYQSKYVPVYVNRDGDRHFNINNRKSCFYQTLTDIAALIDDIINRSQHLLI